MYFLFLKKEVCRAASRRLLASCFSLPMRSTILLTLQLLCDWKETQGIAWVLPEIFRAFHKVHGNSFRIYEVVGWLWVFFARQHCSLQSLFFGIEKNQVVSLDWWRSWRILKIAINKIWEVPGSPWVRAVCLWFLSKPHLPAWPYRRVVLFPFPPALVFLLTARLALWHIPPALPTLYLTVTVL